MVAIMRKEFWSILLFLLSVKLYGQVSFYAETNTKEVKANEPVLFTIMLELNGNEYRQESLIRLPDLSKFEVLSDGSSRNIFLDPDKNIMVDQIVYQILIVPKKIGKLKIGSALVTVNGKIYKTEPFEVSVTGREALSNNKISDDIQLKLQVKSHSVYQHQGAVVELKAYAKNIDYFQRIHDIKLPKDGDNRFYLISGRSDDIEPLEGNILLSQVLGVYVMFPEKSGQVELSKISAKVAGTGKDEIIYSNSKNSIRVKPLPKEAPVGFKNAVGQFEIASDNVVKEVKKGVPFYFTVRLKGVGNLDRLQFPSLVPSKDYKVYPPKITKNIAVTQHGMKGSLVAKYLVVPNVLGDIKLELEPLAYFDPKKESYRTLELNEVNVLVASDSLDKAKTNTLDKVIDNTNYVLETVQLPKIKNETFKSSENTKWYLLGGLLLLSSFLGGFLLSKRLKKKGNAADIKSDLKVQHYSIIDFEDDYRVLRESLEYKNYPMFFDTFDKMKIKVQHYFNSNSINIQSVIEEKKGYFIAEEYRQLVSNIEIEKYAPVKDAEQLNELYYKIINLHNKMVV
ncbi:BatD family protein [Riemerella anatipestifer]|nr:BatD family protein [Riemerella anatipestifer]MCO7318191.1 BatD family protein [Riemerella anatipestifer]MCQ4180369.1 BatD family protein [Riemerella anatipestifer]MDR7796236.1 BatD family protein [Riemerella anatipestifer]MDY3346203.1 BatD family protein [Riemerella anatipestifer]